MLRIATATALLGLVVVASPHRSKSSPSESGPRRSSESDPQPGELEYMRVEAAGAGWMMARLHDENCTCAFSTTTTPPVLLWAISAIGGCSLPCTALPDYALVVGELVTNHGAGGGGVERVRDAGGDLGLPPWKCEGVDTGAFFLSCWDAARLEGYVFCSLSCHCQAEYQALFDAQCPSWPHPETNCGTTCVCDDNHNLNPFARDCDCGTLSSACTSIPVCDSAHPCTQEQQQQYAQEWIDQGCAAAGDHIGVSPGPLHYPPGTCGADPGCDVTGRNSGGGDICPPAPPAIGTSGSGDKGGSGGGDGTNWGAPVSNGGGPPPPWAPVKHHPRTHAPVTK